MMGESPTRPAIFHASPLVVVTPDISPRELSARQLIVPVGGRLATLQAHARVSSSALGNSRFNSADGLPATAGASKPSVQLLWPLASRRDCFHTSHASLDLSMRRFSS